VSPPPKVVLVTGATDGHGRGLVDALNRQGATVLAHGRSADRLAAVPAARSYRADLSSLEEVRAMAADVLENEPRIDVLVNNAGNRPDRPARRVSGRDRARLRRQLPLALPVDA